MGVSEHSIVRNGVGQALLQKAYKSGTFAARWFDTGRAAGCMTPRFKHREGIFVSNDASEPIQKPHHTCGRLSSKQENDGLRTARNIGRASGLHWVCIGCALQQWLELC